MITYDDLLDEIVPKNRRTWVVSGFYQVFGSEDTIGEKLQGDGARKLWEAFVRGGYIQDHTMRKHIRAFVYQLWKYKL